MGTVVVYEIACRGDLGGDASYALLEVAFRRTARRVPAGLLDREDGRPHPVEDVFHWFLLDKLEVLPDELALCVSDEQAAALVERSAKNWLIDRARDTERGSHRHALEKVLRDSSEFVQRTSLPMWALGGAVEDWSGHPAELTAAARGVTGVRPGRRGNDTQRPALAPREDLRRILSAVLAAAAGFVHIDVLTTVVRGRVRAWTAVTHNLEALTEPQQHPALPAHDSREDDQAARDEEVAAAVLAALDQRERVALLHLDDSAALQAALGVGKSQASVLHGRVRARLDALDTSDADLGHVLELLRAALDPDGDRTERPSVRPLSLQAGVTESGGA